MTIYLDIRAELTFEENHNQTSQVLVFLKVKHIVHINGRLCQIVIELLVLWGSDRKESLRGV